MKKLINVNLIKSLGLEYLSLEEQEKIILHASDIIYDSIITRSIGKLDSKAKIELEFMLAHNPSSEEIGKFLYEQVPHLDRIAEEEITSFKKIALENFHTALQPTT